MKSKCEKCFSSLLVFVALTSATVLAPIVISHANNKVLNQQQHVVVVLRPDYKSSAKIDYRQVREIWKKQDFLKIFTEQKNAAEKLNLTLWQFNLIKSLQNSYLNYFKNRNMNLNQVRDFLNENFPEAKCVNHDPNKKVFSELEKVLWAGKSDENKMFAKLCLVTVSEVQEATDKLDYVVQTIKALKVSATTLSVAVGIFATAAWTTHAIPFAINYICISTIRTALAATADAALKTYDEGRSDLKKIASSVSEIIKLGNAMSKFMNPVLTVANATISACDCVMPSSLTLRPAISSIMSLLDYFKIDRS